MRAGWQRFQEPNIRQHQGLFDPASLGFAPAVTQSFNGARYFPAFDFASLSDIGGNLGSDTTHSIYSFQPTFTRLAGSHSLRLGYDLRLYRESSVNPNRQAGQYEFRSDFTRVQDNSGGLFGQDIAAFLLGMPTGGSIDRNARRLNETLYNGIFLQDDWKVSGRLTLNLGLRYDYEGATTDAENRNVRGFDPSAPLSVEAAARTAYAARPIPELAASAFSVRGGLQFASDSQSGFWNADRNNIQPRAGFAYQLTQKTVVRGGVGVYTSPFVIAGVYQPGFSQNTPIVPSLDRGLTFRATLANPFPGGVQDPVGASLGANTFVGQSVGRFAPLNIKNPQNARYVISLQRELPGQWLLDVGYTGSRGWDLTTDLDLNPVPAQYLSTSRQRDQAVINFLGAVPNPFQGLLPNTSMNGTTIGRGQLLRAFPQFAGVATADSNGTSQYNSAQVKVEHRFAKGFQLLAAYTYSRYTERVFKLNPTDTAYENRLSTADVPQRLALSGIWELPFGRGRRWASSGRATDAIVGGWSVQAIGQLQSGRPIDFAGRNIYYDGDPTGLKTKYSKNTDVPVFDTSGFYFHDAAVQTAGVDNAAAQRNDQRIRLASNIRYFPSRINGLRAPMLNLWDISLVKQVHFGNRVRAQFHVEFLNAFNQVYYNNPNTDPTSSSFGKVTSQNSLPRDIQIAAKFAF